MASIIECVPLILQQQWQSPTLQRVPEPTGAMECADSVAQFDQVLDSKLAVAYVVALDLIHGVRNQNASQLAVDLACGPGQFSIFLAEYLQYEQVIGIDLSEPMLQAARQNAGRADVANRVTFEHGDATNLDRLTSSSADLVTFNDAAHHLPNLNAVGQAICEMERIAKPNGMVFVMDLVRLKSARLTDRYVRTIGRDYIARGLDAFYEDFRNSMYAAWTPDELCSAIPASTERTWHHIVPWGLPVMQFLIGVSTANPAAPDAPGSLWKSVRPPLNREQMREWKLLAPLIRNGRKRVIRPQVQNP